MKYSHYEIDQIKDLSFYRVLDYVDKLEHFTNAERKMKYERNKLRKYGEFEKWREKINSGLVEKTLAWTEDAVMTAT